MLRAMVARWLATLTCGACIFQGSVATAEEACFERLDTGVDMTGWKRSTTNHHGPGEGWKVENGAFVGRQTAGNQGGILMTEKSYRDVEVIFEVKIDWGCDSGFFFRTTAGDRGYQVNVDHLEDSGVGTIWGEGFAQELRYRPYYLTEMGTKALKDSALSPSFDLTQWSEIWKPTDFNVMRARVEGNPPRLQVWISDVQVIDYTDTQLRSEIDASGPLAIQVHGGAERWKTDGAVQFKNIRVKDLTLPCDEPDPGSGGAAGAGGGGAGGSAGAFAPTAGANAAGGSFGGASGASGAQAAGGAPSGGAPAAGGGAAGAMIVEPAPLGASDGGCSCTIPRGDGERLTGPLLALLTLGLRRFRGSHRRRALRVT